MICDTLAEKDNRITVIHQANGGLSSARNTGLDNMHGDYVMFVDSDDYTDTNMIEFLLNQIGNADISMCGYTAVSYTHLRAHETDSYLVCRLLLEKKNEQTKTKGTDISTTKYRG